ncbi:protein phosphatase 1 regulatory subunit 7 isoform x1 [Stylonychia lemnae]|uniref:Protein phosphatase 1 regulatory subunit 7 isoform x1 n=1 Tax=Stylonychia lemnae TaxID=5949 RepID=A0A078A6Z6_STYLE|nr:protein phosphatase 1 regulatory subunit 7 isoform x1 [Stylonychia lemnae]|eukprot:CDW76546.1 protein phosphatase 1 regulatory subunit 7 isoform x1 [Stylonychia lemnae]
MNQDRKPIFSNTGSNFNKTATSFTSNITSSQKEEDKQVIIDEALVFRCAMTRDYAKIQEISIISEGVTFIDGGNIMLKQFVNLKKLDLSFNKLAKIDNLDTLKELRELNLSYNRIEQIENLNKLPNLRVLVLDHNKIKQLENLRYLRKLEVLQITGNLLEDLYINGGVTEPMIEIKEIQAGRNKIQNLKPLQHFPNVEEINLSGNPITYIPQDAFSTCTKLLNLQLDEISLKYPETDLKFIASTPGLNRLSMNKIFKDMQTLDGFVDLPELEDLSLQSNGLISIIGIEDKFPNLTVLDISFNRIFSVENIDILAELPNLAEVFFNDNPICVHKHLKELVKNACPFIEVINREEIMESGYRFKEQIFKLKQEMTNSRVGTYQGDRIIEEAENDPNIILSEILKDDLEDENGKNTYGAGKLSEIFQKMQKNQSKTDQAINDFEKNFGLRLQKLRDDLVDIDDPQVDAEQFEKFVSSQFGDLKKNFREVVDNIRTKDYRSFVKINETKAKANESSGTYNKMEEELSKLKQQMEKANQAKLLFNDFFSDIKELKSKSIVQTQNEKVNVKPNQKQVKKEVEDEYYDEEYELEEGEDENINSLYHTSMRLNSRRENKRVPNKDLSPNKRRTEDQEDQEAQEIPSHQPRIVSKNSMKLKSLPGLNNLQSQQAQNQNSKENSKAMLPKSMTKDLDPLRTSQTQLQKTTRGNSQQREARDFIIKNTQQTNSGAINTTTSSNGFGPQFSHQQKKILGMNKPHQLAQQNDIIRQLLEKERSQNSVFTSTMSQQRSGSSFGLNKDPMQTSKVVKEDEMTIQSQTSVQFPLKKRQTPGSVKKNKVTQEPRSQYSELFKFNMSDTFQKTTKHDNSNSKSVTKSNIVKESGQGSGKKGQYDELNDSNDPRENIISDKRLEKQEREAYENSFLVKLFKGYEQENGSKTARNKSPQKEKLSGKNLFNTDLKLVDTSAQSIEQKAKPKMRVPLPRNIAKKDQ